MSESSISCEEVHSIVSRNLPVLVKMEMLKGKTGLRDCIKIGLDGSVDDQNWGNFEFYNAVASKFPSHDYIPALCTALDTLDPRVHPADVLLTLLSINDPRSIPSVRKALFWKPDWDEFHDLAFKAFDVLLTIDNEEAWRVIEEATKDDRAYVRELALKFLQRRRA